MNAKARTRWACRTAVWGSLIAVLSFGCNPLQMIAFMMNKDVKEPAKAPFTPKDDEATGKKKDVTKVALFCNFASPPPLEFANSNRDLAASIVRQFPDVV